MKSRNYIFLENHRDPITGKILLALAPQLSSSGYECFYDENPENFSWQEVIFECETTESIYLDFKTQFAELDLNIENDNDIKKFIQIKLINEGVTDESEINHLLPQLLTSVEEVIKRYSATVTFKAFLKSLSDFHIEYKAIDLSCMASVTSANDVLALKEKRDKNAADIYLNAKSGVFGRAGLVHAEGIQNEILKKLSLEEARGRFCFFYVYSQPACSYENLLEDKVRNGEIIFPINTVIIDATTKTMDEILTLVGRHIDNKQAELNEPLESTHSKFTFTCPSLKEGFFAVKHRLEAFFHLDKKEPEEVLKNNKKIN